MFIHNCLLFYKALWSLKINKLYLKALNLDYYTVIIYSLQ